MAAQGRLRLLAGCGRGPLPFFGGAIGSRRDYPSRAPAGRRAVLSTGHPVSGAVESSTSR